MPRLDRAREQLKKARMEPHALQRKVCRTVFPAIERLGVHVVGDHFYEPVPNLRTIRSSYDPGPRPCHGVDFRQAEAEVLLIDLLRTWGESFAPSAEAFGFTHRNNSFAGVDPVALYSLIRSTRPPLIVEIGQGVSTSVLLAALQDNAMATPGAACRLLSVDPYSRIGRSLATGASRVTFDELRAPLQEVVEALLLELQPDSLLFIDSSHVHKWGSDVAVIFDELLPRLPPGAIVHFHDIYSPFDYPLNWYVQERRFWNEQFILEAFLRYNNQFEVLLPMHLLARQAHALPEVWSRLSQLRGDDFEASSFFLRRTSG